MLKMAATVRVLALVVTLAMGGSALAHDVVVFGDSWAEGAADELAQVLMLRGRPDITVDGRGVSGTTAEYWATNAPTALPDVVSLNPDARWVWLSISGNDVFGHYANGLGAQCAADNERNIRTMLDYLFAVHPDIKVVMFGYDFVNFEQSTECIQLALLVFGPVVSATVNQIFLDDVAAVQSRIAADYPNVTYVPSIWGTLQRAGGIPGAPNILFPSPAQYMSDCIHPNSTGYTLIMNALFDAYWGLPAPVAQIGLPPAPYCEGSTIALTDASVNGSAREWIVAGGSVGTDATVLVPLSTSGPVSVELRSMNGAWEDATATQIQVEPAPPVDAGEDVSICSWGSAQLQASGAATYHWSPSFGLDATDVPNPVAMPGETTTYTVEAWAANGCGPAVDTVTVHIDPGPAMSIDGPSAVNANEVVTYTAAGDATQILWEVAGGAPVASNHDSLTVRWAEEGEGEISLRAFNVLGCESGAALAVSVSPPLCEVGACDDGDPCTADTCDPSVGCVATPGGLDCDDDNVCTDDVCESMVGCVHTPNTEPCDDASACTTDDVCTDGVCGGTPLVCDDGDPCTDDLCRPATGCAHPYNTARCDDGNPCTENDRCNVGFCSGSQVRCDDLNLCTSDLCDPAVGCVYTPNTTACDDGDLCTVGDRCADGVCAGATRNCDDGNPCTDDICDPRAGCVHRNNSMPCDDQRPCTYEDVCAGGICLGRPLNCDDGNACTDDGCDDTTGECTHTANTAACNDTDSCTRDDVCVDGACVGTPVSCDDGDPCTDDWCQRSVGCHNDPASGAACDDGSACTTDDACASGVCTGTPVDCDDANPCTDEACHPATGCASTPNEAPCDDGDSCTTSGCSDGACVALTWIDGCCHEDADCDDRFLRCDTATETCAPVLCRACEGDGDCGVGNRCASFYSGAYCAVDCSDDATVCPEGYVCDTREDDGVLCVPAAGDCECAPNAAVVCAGGQLVTQDSCGQIGESVDDCEGRGCAGDACCEPGHHEDGGACVLDGAEPGPDAGGSGDASDPADVGSVQDDGAVVDIPQIDTKDRDNGLAPDRADLTAAPELSSLDTGGSSSGSSSGGCASGAGGVGGPLLPLLLLAWFVRRRVTRRA